MKTITFYVVAALCLLATKLSAQESFEQRARTIAQNIEKIAEQEKDSLKAEVEMVNGMLADNKISQEEAERRKKDFADKRAKNIEDRVAVEEAKLSELIKDKVDGNVETGGKRTHLKIGNVLEVDSDEQDSTSTKTYSYKRTTSQFVFAIGVNRLIEDGEVVDGFKWRSDFYEWGATFNTRLLKNNNLLHLKYGLSLQYNNLRPDNNRIFVKNGNQTDIEVYEDGSINLDVSRLRYVNLVVPAHLEFDFTPKKSNGDTEYFPTHESIRIGVGGYAGFNVKEKQILKYEDASGNDVKSKTKGDYNVNDFVYGLSAYVGYKSISVYAKYDLQSTFSNSVIDQNTASLGIRFDIN